MQQKDKRALVLLGLEHRRALVQLHDAQIYSPAVVPDLGRGGFYIYSALRVLGHGETIALALQAAKRLGNIPDLPDRPIFTGQELNVVRRGEVVASCVSKRMAARIANALNVYNPDERGS